jgi:hypothetical protein
VTAIRAAGAAGNPETEADPNWLPEVGKTSDWVAKSPISSWIDS